jgi:acetylornithine deacetylase/succinyl-diaminopimelate desuccinylase-like protein
MPDVEIGLDVKAIKTGASSDGNHTSAVAPTIDGLGPQGSRAHSEESSSSCRRCSSGTKMIALFLDRWAVTFAIP